MLYKEAGHEDLWIAGSPEDRGPEENLKMWAEAESQLDDLITDIENAEAESGVEPNEAAYCALVDAYNRLIEERRRAQDLVKLQRKWDARSPGGVTEPEE